MKIELTPEDEMIFRNRVSEDTIEQYKEQEEIDSYFMSMDTLMKVDESTPIVATVTKIINFALNLSSENSKYLTY